MKKLGLSLVFVSSLLGFSLIGGDNAEAASTSISTGQKTSSYSSTVSVPANGVYRVNVTSHAGSLAANVSLNGSVLFSTTPVSAVNAQNWDYRSNNGGNYRVQLTCVSGTNCRGTGSVTRR
ncbi:hypothetical protein AB3N04_00270 (plasmid) [Alkalihalophilus sp. As8PL]|uniref:Uncharacterized protein n=1 Tax=Alkalihalophilus sp. As8PL TaxID=3237103 RepID=A0AB39BNT4_9BACI